MSILWEPKKRPTFPLFLPDYLSFPFIPISHLQTNIIRFSSHTLPCFLGVHHQTHQKKWRVNCLCTLRTPTSLVESLVENHLRHKYVDVHLMVMDSSHLSTSWSPCPERALTSSIVTGWVADAMMSSILNNEFISMRLIVQGMSLKRGIILTWENE